MMGFIWFWLVAVMIVGYVVLDGFDLGVGVLHLFLARNEQERATTLRSIGPVWDGNEVWLLAGGGTLYFAFPLLYASAFSGFYLPLMIVSVAADSARHKPGAAQPYRHGRVARAARRSLRPGERAADDLLRRGAGQCDSRRTAAAQRLFLFAAVDQLDARTFARDSRLVHGDRRAGGAGRAYAARGAVAGAED